MLIIALLISFGLLVQVFQIGNVFALGSENAFLPVVFGGAQFTSEPESTTTPTSSTTPTATSTFTASPTNTSTGTATPTATPNSTSLPEFGKAVVAFNNHSVCDNSTAGGVKFGGTDGVWVNGGSVFFRMGVCSSIMIA